MLQYLFRNPQPEAIRAYTDLFAARVRGPVLCTFCSLVNWVMTQSQTWFDHPLWTCVEGPPLVNHSKFHEWPHRSYLGGIPGIFLCQWEDSNPGD